MLTLSSYNISKEVEHIIGINEEFIFLSITHSFVYDVNTNRYRDVYTLQTLNDKESPLIALRVKLLEYRETYPNESVTKVPFIQTESIDPLAKSALIYINK